MIHKVKLRYAHSPKMKRDMDIIRMLLLQQESGETPPELEHYDQQLIVYNVALMLDAGLIDAHITTDENGTAVHASIMRLTWAGHDFLDSTRDPSIWAKAKERVLKPGMSWTFSYCSIFSRQRPSAVLVLR